MPYVVLVVSLLCAETQAQIGATRSQVERRTGRTMAAGDDGLDAVLGVQSRTTRASQGKLAGLGVNILLRDDTCVAVRVPRTEKTFTLAHLLTLLETWNRHVKDGELTIVKWRVATEFDPVFPQLGNVSQVAGQMQMPLAQGTGVFVDRVTGTAVGQTPWANLSLPTTAYANIRSASSTTKVVIASDDAELYGAVIFGTTQGEFGRSDTVEELFIATRELFWKHTVACVTSTHGSDAYEPALGILIPLDAKRTLRRERLALAFTTAIETRFFTAEQLSAEWAQAVKNDPEFAAAGEGMLAKQFFKRPRPAQTQRTGALGEIGTPESLPLLLQLLKKPDPAPSEARAALRRLATRHFLPDPPPDAALYSEWKKWSDEALRQVRKRP